MILIDSHCHLAGPEYLADLDEVITRARGAGVEAALCILEAEDGAEVARVSAIRSAWPAVRFACGVHPHHAGKVAGGAAGAAEAAAAALESARGCAVGEIGLDYHYDFAPRPLQQEVFRAQVRLAADRALPIIIHTREADADTLRILKEERCDRGVFHCFTGEARMAREALDLGFHLSFAGILTFPKAAELRDVAQRMPLDRILSETDSPYLAPVPHRGKRNEPAYVVRVVETLAGLHGLTREAMAVQIAANFADLFG
jgi:TatD DNase family protein